MQPPARLVPWPQHPLHRCWQPRHHNPQVDGATPRLALSASRAWVPSPRWCGQSSPYPLCASRPSPPSPLRLHVPWPSGGRNPPHRAETGSACPPLPHQQQPLHPARKGAHLCSLSCVSLDHWCGCPIAQGYPRLLRSSRDAFVCGTGAHQHSLRCPCSHRCQIDHAHRSPIRWPFSGLAEKYTLQDRHPTSQRAASAACALAPPSIRLPSHTWTTESSTRTPSLPHVSTTEATKSGDQFHLLIPDLLHLLPAPRGKQLPLLLRPC